MVIVKEERDVETVNAMADSLQELIKNIEPVFHRASEEKARMTGYVQGVTDMMKIVSARMQHLRQQAGGQDESTEQEVVEEKLSQEPVTAPEKPVTNKEVIEFQQEKK